jgi:hypothetical protein
MIMKSITLGLCVSVCLAGAAHAQVNPQDLKWGPAPPIFAPGAQMAVLSGDPSKAASSWCG